MTATGSPNFKYIYTHTDRKRRKGGERRGREEGRLERKEGKKREREKEERFYMKISQLKTSGNRFEKFPKHCTWPKKKNIPCLQLSERGPSECNTALRSSSLPPAQHLHILPPGFAMVLQGQQSGASRPGPLALTLLPAALRGHSSWLSILHCLTQQFPNLRVFVPARALLMLLDPPPSPATPCTLPVLVKSPG